MRRPLTTTTQRNGLWLGLLFVALSIPPVAWAAGIVGDGTPGGCTEAALDKALRDGGSVSFDCGIAPVTIELTDAKIIATDTSVDGGDLVTLDGGDLHVFIVDDKRVALTLARLTITGRAVGSKARRDL